MSFKLLGVSLVALMLVSGAFYWYYKDSQARIQALVESNAKLEIAIQLEREALAAREAAYKQQTAALMTLASENTTLSVEKDKLSEKLAKHDLEELSKRKPVLVEGIINNGTQKLFTSFTDLSFN